MPYPVVALVGYTNAGKSTLFNYVTTGDVLAKDLLFATLDPTVLGRFSAEVFVFSRRHNFFLQV